jgi:hypothetical protein
MDNPNPDYDDDLGEDSDNLSNSQNALGTSQNGYNDKKVSPPRIGDDTKVQNKVARTLVF